MPRFASFLPVLLLCVGCAQRNTVPVEPAAQRELRTTFGDSYSIEGRHLAIPIVVHVDKWQGPLSYGLLPSGSGGAIMLPSGGSGLGFLKSAWPNYRKAHLDLLVVNVADGSERRVFNRPVAIQADRSFHDGKLIFPGTLLIEARVEDADGDKQISERDPVSLHHYDLASGQCTRISPEGADLLELHHADGQLLLVLQPAGRLDLRDVYRYDPTTGTGSHVSEGLRATVVRE